MTLNIFTTLLWPFGLLQRVLDLLTETFAAWNCGAVFASSRDGSSASTTARRGLLHFCFELLVVDLDLLVFLFLIHFGPSFGADGGGPHGVSKQSCPGFVNLVPRVDF